MSPSYDRHFRAEARTCVVLASLVLLCTALVTTTYPEWFYVDGSRPSSFAGFLWFLALLVSALIFAGLPRFMLSLDAQARATFQRRVLMGGGLPAAAIALLLLVRLTLFVAASGVPCEYRRLSSTSLAALGDGPDDVDVFFPEGPLHRTPTDAELEDLEGLEIEAAGLGRRARYRSGPLFVEHWIEPDGSWSGPTIIAPNLQEDSLEAAWGQADHGEWRAGEVWATWEHASHQQCPQLALVLKRFPAAARTIGDSPTSPLAGIDGQLVDQQVDTFPALSAMKPVEAASSTEGADSRTLSSNYAGGTLELVLDSDGRIDRWRLTLPAESGVSLELLESRFGPSVEQPAKRKRGERRMARTRHALKWERHWDGDVLVEVTG